MVAFQPQSMLSAAVLLTLGSLILIFDLTELVIDTILPGDSTRTLKQSEPKIEGNHNGIISDNMFSEIDNE